MPMYEYACSSCGHSDTSIEKINASKNKKCPACGKARAFSRQLSAPAFHLKGSGWYVTDFRDKKGPAKESGKESGEAKSAKDSEKKKPDTSKPAAAKDKKAKDSPATTAT